MKKLSLLSVLLSLSILAFGQWPYHTPSGYEKISYSYLNKSQKKTLKKNMNMGKDGQPLSKEAACEYYFSDDPSFSSHVASINHEYYRPHTYSPNYEMSYEEKSCVFIITKIEMLPGHMKYFREYYDGGSKTFGGYFVENTFDEDSDRIIDVYGNSVYVLRLFISPGYDSRYDFRSTILDFMATSPSQHYFFSLRDNYPHHFPDKIVPCSEEDAWKLIQNVGFGTEELSFRRVDPCHESYTMYPYWAMKINPFHSISFSFYTRKDLGIDKFILTATTITTTEERPIDWFKSNTSKESTCSFAVSKDGKKAVVIKCLSVNQDEYLNELIRWFKEVDVYGEDFVRYEW